MKLNELNYFDKMINISIGKVGFYFEIQKVCIFLHSECIFIHF